MKLAIAQMALGGLMVGSSAVGLFWLPVPEPLAVYRPHSGSLLILLSCLYASVMLGLAVLGCGIAQLLKARK